MYNDTDFQYWQGRESQDITLDILTLNLRNE